MNENSYQFKLIGSRNTFPKKGIIKQPIPCPDTDCLRISLQEVQNIQKKEIKVNINDFPSEFHYIFENTRVYADFTFMKPDTFIHGDFCLPNIILDNWKFSTLIDLGFAGACDRHIDIYWVLWSLNHNLKTDRYTDYFLDLYGKEK